MTCHEDNIPESKMSLFDVYETLTNGRNFYDRDIFRPSKEDFEDEDEKNDNDGIENEENEEQNKEEEKKDEPIATI